LLSSVALLFYQRRRGAAKADFFGQPDRPQCAPNAPPPPMHPRSGGANRAAALETIHRRQMTMQGPFMLAQGYQGLVFRLPIFLPNATATEIWG